LDNYNPEEPFLTIPSKGKGLKPEPKQENQASNGREKQKTKVDKKKTVHLIGTFLNNSVFLFKY
jgi:hypothetical protein